MDKVTEKLTGLTAPPSLAPKARAAKAAEKSAVTLNELNKKLDAAVLESRKSSNKTLAWTIVAAIAATLTLIATVLIAVLRT